MDPQEKIKPKKALLLFDGECPFCRGVATQWEKTLKEKVSVMPAQNGEGDVYGFPRGQKPESVTLIESNGNIFTGAGAVFRLTSIQGGWLGAALWVLYRKVWLFRIITEWGYRVIARYRRLIPVGKN